MSGPWSIVETSAFDPVARADPPQRYLAGDSVDLRRFLPPPPTPGSPLEARDRAMFRTGRPDVGSARWRMAMPTRCAQPTTAARTGPSGSKWRNGGRIIWTGCVMGRRSCRYILTVLPDLSGFIFPDFVVLHDTAY